MTFLEQRLSRRAFATAGAGLAVGLAGNPARAAATTARASTGQRVTVLAHRGASGYRPEHTLEAYSLAVRMGADYIEPDLVSTKDHVLVARHENDITGTTDVADHPEFADRRTTKVVDGTSITGWFTEDFTLAELRTLRAVERLPHVRPGNTRFDGLFVVPTFDEVLALAAAEGRRAGRVVGVAPETKHPTYFREIGLPIEEPMLASLRRAGRDGARSKVVVQSFETGNLRRLRRRTRVPLVQLTAPSGRPYDLAAEGSTTTYADLMTPAGLRQVARYATWIGPDTRSVIPVDGSGALGVPTSLVQDAHRAGLAVVAYTFRAENTYLPTDFRRGTDPDAHGDLVGDLEAYFATGLDAVFCDYPDLAVSARDAWELRAAVG